MERYADQEGKMAVIQTENWVVGSDVEWCMGCDRGAGEVHLLVTCREFERDKFVLQMM